MNITPTKISLAASFALHAALLGGLALDHTLRESKTDIEGLNIQDITGNVINGTITPRTPLPVNIMPEYAIDITGRINDEIGARFIESFNGAITDNGNTPALLSVTLNSVGGNVDEGYLIQDMIKSSGLPTRMVCDKKAASMAAILLITTPAYSREATPDCDIMVHAPYTVYSRDDFYHTITHDQYGLYAQEMKLDPPIMSWTIEDLNNRGTSITITRASMERMIKNNDDLTERFAIEIAANSNLSEDDARYMLNQGDVRLTPIEAHYLGFIDRIEGVTMDTINTAAAYAGVCEQLPMIEACASSATAAPLEVMDIEIDF